MKNKKGLTTFQLFLFIFACFFGIIFLGLGLWGFNLFNDALDQDVMVGQVNLSEANNITFGAMNRAYVDNADTLGIILLLGMSLIMILNGYLIGSKWPKLFFVVDILLLIFIFIVAVYISQVYEIFINSTDLLNTIYVNDLPKSSTFVLNLPTIIGTLGALIMIASYAGIKRREKREVNVYGY